MTFVPKTWQDVPSAATPLSAAALIDLETRLAAYTDLAGTPSFNVKAFGAIGNGIADDTSAFTSLINAINATSGTSASIPAGTYKITSTLPTLTSPVVLSGNASGIVPATFAGTVLKFSAGVPGLTLGAGAQYSRLHNLYLQSLSVALGTDDGLSSVAHGIIAENIVIDGFGRNGVIMDTSSTGNANNSVLRNVRCVNSKANGFRILGTNSNLVTLTSCDATSNGAWGYKIDSAHCVLVAPHTDQNVSGGFQDNGNSNMYLMPYVESGTGYNVTLAGANAVWIQGNYTSPTITNSGGITNFILRNGFVDKQLQIGDTGASGHDYQFNSGSFATSAFALTDVTAARNIFDIDGAGTRFEMLLPLLLSGGLSATTGTTAPGAGGAGALPATPAGYITVKINGTNRQLPYY